MRGALLAVLAAGCGFSTPSSPGDAARDTGSEGSGAIGSPRKLVFANSQLTTNLDDVPVLVPITNQIDKSRVTNPSTDLRFEDPSTHAELPYEVEVWNPNGESLVWVRVPQIVPAPVTSAILMYFGPGVRGASTGNVWSSYEQVNHFATDASDSAGNGHTGTISGSTMIPAYLGNGARFINNGDRITFAVPTIDQWAEFTLEMWIKPSYTAIGQVVQDSAVLDNGGSLRIGRFFTVSSTLVFQIDVKWSGAASYIHPDLPLNAWSHVAWVYDGQALHVYRNGLELAVDGVGTHDTANTTGPLVLGSAAAGAKMDVDELRIARAGFSPDWMHAQELAMTRSFVTFTDP